MDKKTLEALAIVTSISFVFVVPLCLASVSYYIILDEHIAPRISIDPKNPPDSNRFLGSTAITGWSTGDVVYNLSLSFIVVSTLLSSYAFAKGRSLRKDRAIMLSVAFLITGLAVFFLGQFALKAIFKSLMPQ